MLQIFTHLEMVYAELPFEADECQVIYVDNGASHALNSYVKYHLKELKKMFRAEGLDFCYMPAMFADDEELSEIVRYRMPWLKDVSVAELEKIRAVKTDELTDIINRRTSSAGVAYTGQNEEIVMKVDISQPGIYWNQFEEIAKSYGRKVRETLSWKKKYDPCIYDLISTFVDKKPKGVVREVIEKALGEDIKLSRVTIGRSGYLHLPDYGMAVHLRPMEMTLFILFLNHPEGILLKELINYKEEIDKIYRRYTISQDDAAVSASIDNLFDFSTNALNEHRSRLKTAFEQQFDGVIAKNYYITGRKGQTMQITLPRDLVVWEA